jgi:VWFA-related protein
MTRTSFRVLLLASAMTATVTVVAQQPLFRAGVEIVRVDVSVVLGEAPVTGLRLEDFEVRDQGARQQLTGLLYEEVPLDAYLVLDASASVAGRKLADLRHAAMAFLAGLRTGDEAALLSFSQMVTQHQPLTGDLAAIRRALEAVTTGGTTALHDALFAAMLQRQPNERRAVAVVFSDGFENVSWLSEADVMGTAERSDMLVYGVTLTAEPRGGRARTPVENAFLRRVTAATGGRIWTAGGSAQLEEAFVAVLRDIRSRYLLTYTPESPPRPGWHSLQVKLKRGKGQVIARPGYFVR